MATRGSTQAPGAAAPRSGGVWGWVFFDLVALGAVVFYFAAAFRYFNYSEATYGERYWPHANWLLAHVIGGSLALSAGLFQIWSGLRGVKLRHHGWIGKTYFGGVLLGSTSAFYLAAVSDRPTFAIAFSGLGVAWLVTSTMAYLAIRNGQIEIHKEWVIRSYVVTYGLVNFRWIVELPVLAGPGVERLATAGWLCWTIPLVFTEVVLQWRRTIGSTRRET